MYQITCPSCRNSFHVQPQMLGTQVICPNCKSNVILPSAEKVSADFKKAATAPSHEADADDKLSRYTLIFVLIFVVNLTILLGISLISNVAVGIFFLLIAIIIEIAIWRRKEIIAIISTLSKKESPDDSEQVVDAETVDKPIQNTQRKTNRDYKRTTTAAENDDDLVTVQTARSSVVDAEVVPKPPSEQVGSIGRKKTKFGNLPPYPKFFGVNDTLDLGFARLHVPLVYATSKPQQGQFDASLIDNTLPISDSNRAPDRLPYWPTYYDATPVQRATYLKWLLGGKSDPKSELGYVFLYFYGLEHRVLVENSDHAVIADELIRLLKIYGTNNSFKNYATRLMWLTIFLHSRNSRLNEKLLERAIKATTRWNDELVDYALATIYESKSFVTSEIAIVIASNDHRSTNSVIVRRHEEQFNDLFKTKFQKQFGSGLQLKASKRAQSIQYNPASPTFIYNDHLLKNLPKLPDVARISSQFKPLVELWETCIEELKTYNRVHNKSDGKMTSEVYESLPAELRTDDHPEYDQWMQLWEKHADPEGWPIVPVSELAKLKGIEPRNRLTKTQCRSILQTATAIGIGFVPDIEITGRNFGWDEPVCLFFEDPQAQHNPAGYKAAAILLRLGMSIAAADGSIDKLELQFIDEFLEDSFDLPDADSNRLECLSYLLSKCPDADNRINKALCKHLTKLQRKMVGEFLVGIALADQVLDPGEIKALKQAYRSLELEQSDLDELLNQAAPTETSSGTETKKSEATEPLKLDMKTIDHIMTETRSVSKVLQEAMSEDLFDDIEDEPLDDEPAPIKKETSPNSQTDTQTKTQATERESNVATVVPSDQFPGLPERFHAFLNMALTQQSWSEDQLEALARENGQMLSGIVEAINEWSMEQFEDWLVEEDGSDYLIHREILELS